MSTSRILQCLLVAGTLSLYGCASKSVTAIPMVQPGDETLTCQDIRQQSDANTVAISGLVRKDRGVENENTAKVVGGAVPVVGPLIVGSADLSNEEQVKARSLIDRNERLSYLARSKGCPT